MDFAVELRSGKKFFYILAEVFLSVFIAVLLYSGFNFLRYDWRISGLDYPSMALFFLGTVFSFMILVILRTNYSSVAIDGENDVLVIKRFLSGTKTINLSDITDWKFRVCYGKSDTVIAKWIVINYGAENKKAVVSFGKPIHENWDKLREYMIDNAGDRLIGEAI